MIDTYDLTVPSKPTIDKAIGATLDYSQTWKEWLTQVGDTIASVSVDVEPTGLVKESDPVFSDGVVSVMLSGGILNKIYRVIFTIITAAGRKDQRSIYIRIVNR